MTLDMDSKCTSAVGHRQRPRLAIRKQFANANGSHAERDVTDDAINANSKVFFCVLPFPR